MHVPYEDITSRIAEAPLWWSTGVPRYEPFKPGAMNVYAEFAVLLRVECQACAREFHVGMHGPNGGFVRLTASRTEELTYLSDDPPHHQGRDGANCTGNTMGWVLLDVVEAWERNAKSNWVRRQKLEEPRG